MKHASLQIVCNLLLLLWLSMAASCTKLELPGEGNGGGEPGGGDVASADTSSALTVAEFSAAPLDEMVWVQGYIVGYLSGTTLSSACYTAEGAGDTNLLLGTAADTQDVEESIPLQLPKDTYGHPRVAEPLRTPGVFRASGVCVWGLPQVFRSQGPQTRV